MKLVQFKPELTTQEVTLDNILMLKGKPFYGEKYNIGDVIYFVSIYSNDNVKINTVIESETEQFLSEHYLISESTYAKKTNI